MGGPVEWIGQFCKCVRGSSLKQRLNFEPIRALGQSGAITCRRLNWQCQPVSGEAGSKFSQLRNNKDFRAAAVLRMEGWLTLLLVVINIVVDPCLAGVPPPVWSRTYAVEGILSIPYAEIEVKFNMLCHSFFSSTYLSCCSGAFCCLGRSGRRQKQD